MHAPCRRCHLVFTILIHLIFIMKNFGQTEFDFLGHRIDDHGISPLP